MDDKILMCLKEEHWMINVCLFFSILAHFYFAYKNKFEDFEVLFLDMLSLVILNFVFAPLIAFTIYFCFLHSIRHIISISHGLNSSSFSDGVCKCPPLSVGLIIKTPISLAFAACKALSLS